MTLKKYIGSRAFYRSLLAVMVPILIQNGITNFISLLDNVMVGQIGTEQMSGVSIVNQLLFVFYLCIFGAISGAGLFGAQFFGKGDHEGVRATKRNLAAELNAKFFAEQKAKLEKHLAIAKAAAEGGSAGADYATGVVGEANLTKVPVQMNAFAEVKAGAVDFIVVDIILAKNICGEADYADLAIVDAIQLKSEIYAVGFKKGSELTAKVNAAIKTLNENGTLKALAKKYGFENVLQVTEKIDF